MEGDIMYLDAVGQPPEKGENVVADLLDRHAGIYSDSPHNIVAYKIFTASVLVAFTCYAYYGDVSVEAYHDFHPILVKTRIAGAARGKPPMKTYAQPTSSY